MILTALLTGDNSYIKTTRVDATLKMAERPGSKCKKVGGHLQYRGCTNTIIERAKNFNHAKSCLDKKTY